MTRRELIDALRPAAGAEAEIEAKFLLEASADEAWLRAAVARRLKGEPLQYEIPLEVAVRMTGFK